MRVGAEAPARHCDSAVAVVAKRSLEVRPLPPRPGSAPRLSHSLTTQKSIEDHTTLVPHRRTFPLHRYPSLRQPDRRQVPKCAFTQFLRPVLDAAAQRRRSVEVDHFEHARNRPRLHVSSPPKAKRPPADRKTAFTGAPADRFVRPRSVAVGFFPRRPGQGWRDCREGLRDKPARGFFDAGLDRTAVVSTSITSPARVLPRSRSQTLTTSSSNDSASQVPRWTNLRPSNKPARADSNCSLLCKNEKQRLVAGRRAANLPRAAPVRSHRRRRPPHSACGSIITPPSSPVPSQKAIDLSRLTPRNARSVGWQPVTTSERPRHVSRLRRTARPRTATSCAF